MQTENQYLTTRADAVEEILTGRHPEHDQLALAINRARNAVMAGLSAHAALARGDEWIEQAGDVDATGELRTTLAQALAAIPGTNVRNIYPTATGYQADLIDYHTGRRAVIRIDEVYSAVTTGE